jgi:hypothetical protein
MEDHEIEPDHTERMQDNLTFNVNTTDRERENLRASNGEQRPERDQTLSEILSNVSDIQRQLAQVSQMKRHNVLNETQEIAEAFKIVCEQKLPAIFKILNLLSQFTREQERWNDRIRALETASDEKVDKFVSCIRKYEELGDRLEVLEKSNVEQLNADGELRAAIDQQMVEF